MTGAARWSIDTPRAAPGAIALLRIDADDAPHLERVAARLRLDSPEVGGIVLADLLGLDRIIVARPTPRSLALMPHGGPALLREIAAALAAAGLEERTAEDPRAAYPEAPTLLEARMLHAIARAHSHAALDLLLDQPARWRSIGALLDDPEPPVPADAVADDRSLRRLIDPPLVVLVGAANIGKSTLLNALAGRSVAIVADEPGTTRDHVGALVDLAGVVARVVDTPGERAGGATPEREAADIARLVARDADLLVLCADSSGPAPRSRTPGALTLTVALRADLAPPAIVCDIAVSARTGAGMPELVERLRDGLVPPAALRDPRPWRFW